MELIMKKLNLSMLLLLISVLLTACGGGSDGGDNNDPSVKGLTPPSHIEVIK